MILWTLAVPPLNMFLAIPAEVVQMQHEENFEDLDIQIDDHSGLMSVWW
jgi:hypothetical protein